MYNFLDPKLLPKVSPAAGCLEGYETSNLISENPLIKSRGFLTYSCIKPPVDVDFELICPVVIHYISVTCKIGTQRATGIELQAKQDGASAFVTIGKAFLGEDKVLFCNSRCYKKEQTRGTSESVCVVFFKSYLFRIFNNAKFVRVRILRTERSTPGLGPVEIWGRVSKSCPEITLRTIDKLMLKNDAGNRNNASNSNYFSSGEKSSDEFEISDDFKDALTFEVMALPMTLPSGHSVDQSTLDKCAANDAMYGRRPSDPFTGLPFTENRKPKLNAALKNRIDMFLLENAHRKETYNIGRTIGSNIIKTTGDSSLLNNFSCRNKINNISSNNPFVYNNINNKRTRSCMEGHSCKPSTSTNHHECNSKEIKKLKTNCYEESYLNNLQNAISESNHESSSNDNLDEAIAKVMNSSSFVSFTKEVNSVEDNKSVIKMCSFCFSGLILYALPCGHIYCKKCLMSVCDKLICVKCNRNFCKKDVMRVHNI